jgi:hypothetical protein
MVFSSVGIDSSPDKQDMFVHEPLLPKAAEIIANVLK